MKVRKLKKLRSATNRRLKLLRLLWKDPMAYLWEVRNDYPFIELTKE